MNLLPTQYDKLIIEKYLSGDTHHPISIGDGIIMFETLNTGEVICNGMRYPFVIPSNGPCAVLWYVENDLGENGDCCWFRAYYSMQEHINSPIVWETNTSTAYYDTCQLSDAFNTYNKMRGAFAYMVLLYL